MDVLLSLPDCFGFSDFNHLQHNYVTLISNFKIFQILYGAGGGVLNFKIESYPTISFLSQLEDRFLGFLKGQISAKFTDFHINQNTINGFARFLLTC